MLIPSRDLPVSEAISKLRPRMEECMSELKSSKTDAAALNDFLNMFDAPYLKGAPFLEEGPTLKQARLSLACAALRPSFAADRSLRLLKPPVHRLLGCCILVSALSSSVGNREPG